MRKESRRFLYDLLKNLYNMNMRIDTVNDKIILYAYKETNVFESTSDDRPIVHRKGIYRSPGG